MKLEKETFSDTQVQEFLQENTVAIHVDVTKQQALAAKFGVGPIPNITFVNAKGERVGSILGFRPPAQFLTAAKEQIN